MVSISQKTGKWGPRWYGITNGIIITHGVSHSPPVRSGHPKKDIDQQLIKNKSSLK
jgi:hypothetical protein